ncbi:recombinase family protein [Dehalobacter restrictus]|uniref:recombinase family protein n=1 Tax=Dehalobacter restrictus TaxID=55583 RepID=UPI00338F310B
MEREIAAIYCRLSQDDGDLGESGSIQTQKSILTRYCKDNHIAIGDIYSDDGYTGQNFNRPDFRRMMDDIDAGKINVVIVNDLSRFGREYAEMGLIIEHYFEEKGVRFISLYDRVDTAKSKDNLIMAITNVMNSFYARQASSKTKAAHKARAQDGMYLAGHALFGYMKDPNDRHKLIIDPPAADVVREIFQLFAAGVGYVRMTKILRERKILNPMAYFNQNNPDYFKSDYWRKPFDWHATSVRSILMNQAYIGNVVFGKTKVKGLFDKKRIPAPQEEWIIVENMHEPLISRELWDTVQQLMKSRRRENSKGEIQMFAGLVKCSKCGSSLNVNFDKKKGKYTGFSCWVYKNYGKERCTSHAIGWKTMGQLVLEDIRRNAKAAKLAAPKYKEMLISAKTEKKKQETEKCKRELKTVDKRIAELDKIMNKLYEDLALEKVSEERYQTMSKGYEAEQSGLKERRNKLTEIITRVESVYENIEKFLPIIKKYTDITELNTHILNELIQKIVVYEKTDNPDGSKSQRVDIHYKFIGYVEMKEMFGLPMLMAMAKDVEIDDALIAEAKELARELAG